jgi:hypothetical protein
MPSNRFEDIFDGAASIVESRCRGMDGVRAVLDDIRDRGRSPVKDFPRNRNLIVEPWIVSQKLHVPLATVESVAAELHKLNVLHLWVRVHCPAADDDDEDDVILETSDPKEFKRRIQEECPHCGQFHDTLTVRDLERFYAIHFDDRQDRFSIGHYILKKSPKFAPDGDSTEVSSRADRPSPSAPTRAALPTDTGPLSVNRVLVMLRLEQPEGRRAPLVDRVTHALETNERSTVVPSVNRVVTTLWKWSITSFGVLIAVLLVLYFLVPTYILIFVLGAYFFLYALCCNYTLKAFFSGSYLPKLVATYSFGLAGVLLASSRFDIDTGFGKNVPWHFSIKSGAIHWHNIIGAAVLVIAGIVGMVYLQSPKS